VDRPQKLTPDQVTARLETLPAWALDDSGALVREFTFSDFAEAMRFANRVAELAEGRNHHPDLFVSWGQVTVRLSTHSVGGLTDADVELARAIG